MRGHACAGGAVIAEGKNIRQMLRPWVAA